MISNMRSYQLQIKRIIDLGCIISKVRTDFHMARPLFCAIVVLSLLLTAAEAQRGGSTARVSTSSRSSSKGRSWFSIFRSQNSEECFVDGVNVCTTTLGKPLSWLIIIIGVIFFWYLIFGKNKENNEQNQRKRPANATAYDLEPKALPSLLGDTQRTALLEAFKRKSFTMIINLRGKAENFYSQVRVLDIKIDNDAKYKITLSGNDGVGTSKMYGFLSLSSNGVALKFSKIYDDRTKAKQLGSFDSLVYEGTGSIERMEGKWAFSGYQSSSKYSGTWSLTAN